MACEGEVIDWQPEQIPDPNRLFMRIHETFRKPDGTPAPGAFRNHGEGMSTDWQKYATPQETRRRAKQPEHNAVVTLHVGSVRQLPEQQVEHTPDVERDNRAHTDVYGKKDEEVRIKLKRIAEIVIEFDAPVE